MTAAKEAYVGIDVGKLRNAVAIADAGREGEIRFEGLQAARHPQFWHRLPFITGNPVRRGQIHRTDAS